MISSTQGFVPHIATRLTCNLAKERIQPFTKVKRPLYSWGLQMDLILIELYVFNLTSAYNRLSRVAMKNLLAIILVMIILLRLILCGVFADTKI